MPAAPKAKGSAESKVVLRWPEIKDHHKDEEFCREFILPKLGQIGMGRFSAMPGESENPDTQEPEPSMREYFDWREDPKSTPDVFTREEKTILAGFCDQQGIVFERRKGGPKAPPVMVPTPEATPIDLPTPLPPTSAPPPTPSIDVTTPPVPKSAIVEPVAERPTVPVVADHTGEEDVSPYLYMVGPAVEPTAVPAPMRSADLEVQRWVRQQSAPSNSDARTMSLLLVAFHLKTEHRTVDEAVLDLADQFGVQDGLSIKELLRVANFAFESPAR